MSRGILFTGKENGGIVQIENLTPSITATFDTNGNLQQLQITVTIKAGKQISEQPAKIDDEAAFIPLKDGTNELNVVANVGTLSFLENSLSPGRPSISLGMTGNGGKVGGPGFLFASQLKKKPQKRISKKKK